MPGAGRSRILRHLTIPEGLSIVILWEAVEALHLKGKVIKNVEGNANIDKDLLINQKVSDFRS